MARSDGYKAQYKPYATSQWQTKLTGSEVGALQEKERLQQKYPFARVVDSDDRLVG